MWKALHRVWLIEEGKKRRATHLYTVLFSKKTRRDVLKMRPTANSAKGKSFIAVWARWYAALWCFDYIMTQTWDTSIPLYNLLVSILRPFGIELNIECARNWIQTFQNAYSLRFCCSVQASVFTPYKKTYIRHTQRTRSKCNFCSHNFHQGSVTRPAQQTWTMCRTTTPARKDTITTIVVFHERTLQHCMTI